MSVDKDPETRVARELIEFLNELRVVLPGVQVLFGFLLAVPFSDHFDQVTGPQRDAYFAAFLCSAVATGFLLAPSLYHRLHWRRDVQDQEQMLRTFNRLAITGGVFVAIAMSLTVFVVTDLLYPVGVAAVLTGVCVCLFGWLWYGLPLSRRRRERSSGA